MKPITKQSSLFSVRQRMPILGVRWPSTSSLLFFAIVFFFCGIAISSQVLDSVESADTVKLTNLTWVPLNPEYPDGVAMATLWGDPKSTAYGALLRVPPGFESPMHTHSYGERIVQLIGESVHWEPGGNRNQAPVLVAGDYFSMPAHRPHVSATNNELSIELIIQDGPFDFQLVQ